MSVAAQDAWRVLGDDTPAADVRALGGKAVQLLRLRALGCRVPDFVVVTLRRSRRAPARGSRRAPAGGRA